MNLSFHWASEEELSLISTRFKMFLSGDSVFVGYVDKQLAGFVSFEGKEVEKIYVDEKFRGNFSEILVKNALKSKFLRNSRLRFIRGEAIADDPLNQEALERWYRRIGFEPIKRDSAIIKYSRKRALAHEFQGEVNHKKKPALWHYAK